MKKKNTCRVVVCVDFENRHIVVCKDYYARSKIHGSMEEADINMYKFFYPDFEIVLR